ncbi:MAG TPA: hypothetical protein VF979_07980 [Streptosporangiaceae bacterium]
MADPITVLIADDQQLVRRGFKVILESEHVYTSLSAEASGFLRKALRDRVQAVVLAYEIGLSTPETQG